MFRERCSLRLSGLFVFARLLLHKMASDFLPQKIEEGGEGEGGCHQNTNMFLHLCSAQCDPPCLNNQKGFTGLRHNPLSPNCTFHMCAPPFLGVGGL